MTLSDDYADHTPPGPVNPDADFLILLVYVIVFAAFWYLMT